MGSNQTLDGFGPQMLLREHQVPTQVGSFVLDRFDKQGKPVAHRLVPWWVVEPLKQRGVSQTKSHTQDDTADHDCSSNHGYGKVRIIVSNPESGK